MHILNAAIDGIGLAYVHEKLAAPYLVGGRLKQALTNWCPYFQGYYLYYPIDAKHRPRSQHLLRHSDIEAECPLVAELGSLESDTFCQIKNHYTSVTSTLLICTNGQSPRQAYNLRLHVLGPLILNTLMYSIY